MNPVDVVLLIVLLMASFRGWQRGAVNQLFAFGGALLGLIAGASAAPEIAARFVDQPGLPLAFATFALLVAAVMLGQFAGYVIGVRLRVAAERSGIGTADSVMGVVVGLVSILTSLWLAGPILAQGPTPMISGLIRGSQVLQTIEDTMGPAPDVIGRAAGFLDQQGFPQVFAGLGGATAPPVDPPSGEAVQAAAAAGAPGTVQIESLGCGGVSSGSGFVVAPGFVVTNAHVVAGGEVISVRDAAGTHEAVPIHFDPDLDVAVLASPDTIATPLAWTDVPADRGTQGATLGHPGGQRTLNVRAAAVRGRQEAIGRDIYGRNVTTREILTLDAGVQPGDSGGPFVTAAGQVGGVVFAASTAGDGVGYALTAERVRPLVDAAMASNSAVATGSCRF